MTDLCHMEMKAWLFLRAWPDVPDALRPVYARFRDLGFIWVDPNSQNDPTTWPGGLRLTNSGQMLKDEVDFAKVNVFDRSSIGDLLPPTDLDGERRIFRPGEPPPAAAGVRCDGHPSAGPRGLKGYLATLEVAVDDAIEQRRRRKGKRRGH